MSQQQFGPRDITGRIIFHEDRTSMDGSNNPRITAELQGGVRVGITTEVLQDSLPGAVRVEGKDGPEIKFPILPGTVLIFVDTLRAEILGSYTEGPYTVYVAVVSPYMKVPNSVEWAATEYQSMRLLYEEMVLQYHNYTGTVDLERKTINCPNYPKIPDGAVLNQLGQIYSAQALFTQEALRLQTQALATRGRLAYYEEALKNALPLKTWITIGNFEYKKYWDPIAMKMILACIPHPGPRPVTNDELE